MAQQRTPACKWEALGHRSSFRAEAGREPTASDAGAGSQLPKLLSAPTKIPASQARGLGPTWARPCFPDSWKGPGSGTGLSPA